MADKDNFSDLQELGVDLDLKITPLTASFNRAAQHLQTLLNEVDNQTLLVLYGYYKQGLDGPCNIAKPYWFDAKGKSKWEAWNKLGNMSQDEAKMMYIETIKSIDPHFECDDNGVKVSCMVEDPIIPFEDMTIIDYIKRGDEEIVGYLLGRHKESLNELDNEGLTLLHWAADSGSLEIIKLLVESGAAVNVLDVDGLTPLHYASSCGYIDCVEYLLTNGADKTILDNDGSSPLDLAADDDVREILS